MTILCRAILFLLILSGTLFMGKANAQYVPPEAPASWSWLPHGHGATMVSDHPFTGPPTQLHGFRVSPAYVGCVRLQVWGWDVNSRYVAPSSQGFDPGKLQLPLGLTYRGPRN